MNTQFNVLRQCRANVLKIVNKHSLEALNTIPQGFNNNLIWNFAHIIVTQQLLCYRLSGLPCLVSDDMIDQYRKGTRPGNSVDQNQLYSFLALFNYCIDQLEEDYQNNLFVNYKEYATSFGLVLQNIDQAIAFNNAHEALHLGSMMAIQKFV